MLSQAMSTDQLTAARGQEIKFQNQSTLSPIFWETNQGQYACSILELKQRLFNFPALLSDCRVFSPSEIVPVSHALLLTQFFSQVSKQRRLYSIAKKPQPPNFRSQFSFPDRLVILNEERILSNNQKKGFCRAFQSKTLPGCRAYSNSVLYQSKNIPLDKLSSVFKVVTNQVFPY